MSIAYLALVREGRVAGGARARWRGFYEFLPWEDARRGRPALVDGAIAPALARWVGAASDPETRRARRERADITFGLRGAAFDGVRVLERYELLYEAGLVSEAIRGTRTGSRTEPRRPSGEPMALDHRRLLATALGPPARQAEVPAGGVRAAAADVHPAALQRVVEALAGAPLHKQNFRRLVETGGLVEGTGGRGGPHRRAGPPSSSASAARCCASAARPAWACRAAADARRLGP